MTHANHTGLWYHDLPDHCYAFWPFYDQTLQQALTGSSANLGDSDLTRHLVQEFSGYQILWLLASIAGHPGVAISVLQPTMPRQRRDTSFHDYMQLWSHFLHLEHCRGIAYSDVYFVEMWLEYLHPSYNDTLKPLIFNLLRDCNRNVPVPIHFSPEHLINYICSRAHTIGMYNLTPSTTPSTMTVSSSRRTPASIPTRQLQSSHPVVSQDVRLVHHDLPDDIFASVCSLMANNTSQRCDLCSDTGHLMASCPILHCVIADPVKTRRPLSALERAPSSRGGSSQNSRARTPTSSNRTATTPLVDAATRALNLDNDDTDDDTVIRQLTDDEGSQGSADPDFP